ncbi:MAG: hypothetical protein FWE32_10715 [Oscillospiraceae bacterium]|nr:hypothetical protein [Oscillospiraceae bacterium]
MGDRKPAEPGNALSDHQKLALFGVYRLAYKVLTTGVQLFLLALATFQLVSLPVLLIGCAITLAGASVVTFGYARRGIWAEFYKPTLLNNAIISGVTGLVSLLALGVTPMWVQVFGLGYFTFEIFLAAGIAVFTFVSQVIITQVTLKQAAKLEAGYKD